MTLTKRVVVTLSLALLGLVFVSAYGLWALHQSQARFQYVQDKTFPAIQALSDVSIALNNGRIANFQHTATFEASQKALIGQQITASDQLMDSALATYRQSLVIDEADRKRLIADEAAIAAYRTERAPMLEKSATNDTGGASKILTTTLADRAAVVDKALSDHIASHKKLAAELNRSNTQDFTAASRTLIAVAVAAFLIVAGMAVYLARTIRTSLSGIQRTIQHVSSSLDFTRRAPVMRIDEIGKTATAFNELLDRLQLNLQTVLGGAMEIADASRQMANSADRVSTCADAQSEASANMAAAVEQLTVSVSHVASRAGEAYELARGAGELAQSGSTTIRQTITDIRDISTTVSTATESIDELETYNTTVSRVVQVIKEIADQTNLLALNAAIEAARAGEQGRGFAVVADEVRKLAERTSASTVEIASTIRAMRDRSQQVAERMQTAGLRVRDGVQRADAADQAIHQIGESSLGTAEVVSEISVALRQQGAASENMAAQVEHIAQMAEEASQAIARAAGSARRLDDLAAHQMETLQQYRL